MKKELTLEQNILVFIGIIFLVPVFLMFAWNWSLPIIFAVYSFPTIGYWQAFFLYFLSNILFKNMPNSKS